MSTVLEALMGSIRAADRYNPDVEVSPACILWPDGEGQWSTIIPRLLDELPELIIYGEYAPERRQGPAIWLRCVIADQIEDVSLPKDRTPIIYLPGVSRQQLRDVENFPVKLAPLVELQFRGAYWSQANTRDWTALAFLRSNDTLGLDVAQDEQSKQSLLGALRNLLDEDVANLRGKRLDKHFFNLLIAGGDPTRQLLLWLDHEDAFRNDRSEEEWQAFVELCKSTWGFNPEADGPIVAATKLAYRDGAWESVWNRFCEAPGRYGNIPEKIRRAEPPRGEIFWFTDDGSFDGWPQWNEEQEGALRQALSGLATVLPQDARKKLVELERQHGRRRETVWAELGQAPLAEAMEHLNEMANVTEAGLNAGTLDDLIAAYSNSGWKADDAVLKALACVDHQQDVEAVTTAIRSIYLPWADEAAEYFQKLADEQGYPGGIITGTRKTTSTAGECLLFVDGLRFDMAKRLVDILETEGLTVSEEISWAALPTITATAKPAVSPVRHQIRGDHSNKEFVPKVMGTEQILNSYHLKKLLKEADWQVLDDSDQGSVDGYAWVEFGNIDEAGHHQNLRLAKQIDEIVKDLLDRIMNLLSSGWKTVRVVTDHGWLLMPGGLPKAELPSALAETKWGRFALIKPGIDTKTRLFPWFWNPDRFVALADGIRSFRQGMIYTHGGMSFQECLTLELTVSGHKGSSAQSEIHISNLAWQGLRCRVVVDGSYSGISVDLRLRPGDPSSSVASTIRKLRDDGTGSVVVEDEEQLGQDATLVLITDDGSLVAQKETVIGGEAS